MNSYIFILIASIFWSGSGVSSYDSKMYFSLINEAELHICRRQYEEALETYALAFDHHQKPFGKDLFNAALCSQLSLKLSLRDKYLQKVINNSSELAFVQSKFVGTYMTNLEWQNLMDKRSIEYDKDLREEFVRIKERDQLFRPMYETHDDTIYKNERINLTRILRITDSIGFPSHLDLGYTEYLRGQNYDIVLHHTAQRRSGDKSALDLEPVLRNAVKQGRFDPEAAIFYMNFQNDLEKGKFEVYSIWQFKHPLLPDSLNNKIWLPHLNADQKNAVNNKRKEWYANTIDEIAAKASFLTTSNLPFIFTCVRKSISNLSDSFDKTQALEQYNMITSSMVAYKGEL